MSTSSIQDHDDLGAFFVGTELHALDFEALMTLEDPATSLEALQSQRLAGTDRMRSFKAAVNDAMRLTREQEEACAALTIQSAWRKKRLRLAAQVTLAAVRFGRRARAPMHRLPSQSGGEPKAGDEAAGVQPYVSGHPSNCSKSWYRTENLAVRFVFETADGRGGTNGDGPELSDRERLLKPPRALRTLKDKAGIARGWHHRQLLYAFNKFGLGARPAYQVELFERAIIMAEQQGDPEAKRFVSIPRARMFYGQALRRMGFVADAIDVLQKLRRVESLQYHGEASNYLGDAYVMRSQAANDMADALEQRDSLNVPPDFHATLPDLIERFTNHVQTRQMRRTGTKPNLALSSVLQTAQRALDKAKQCYAEHFEETCSHEGLLRVNTLELKHTRRLHLRKERLVAELAEVEEGIRQSNDSIAARTALAYQAVLKSGGSEARDVWIRAGALETASFNLYCQTIRESASGNALLTELPSDSLKPLLAGVIAQASSPHQLATIRNRLHVIHEACAPTHSAKAKLAEALQMLRQAEKFVASGQGAAISTLARQLAAGEAGDGVGRGGDADAAAGADAPATATEAKGIRVITPAMAGDNAVALGRMIFDEHTFNLRGVVDAPRPMYIPGCLSVTGGRVPNLLFGQQDSEVFATILQRWGCADWDNVDVFPDHGFFRRKLTQGIRDIFQTWNLHNLHSAQHQKFDITSDATIELVGIPPAWRKGIDCTSNVSSALLFFGDCREHAISMLSFHDFWQLMHVNAKLRAANSLLAEARLCTGADDAVAAERRQRAGKLLKMSAAILQKKLRGAHVTVFAAVQMVKTYYPVGVMEDPEGAIELEREYTLLHFRQRQPLTKYEAENSFLLLEYKDGTRARMGPYWDETRPKGAQWRMRVDRDMVPVIDSDHLLTSLQLINKIEEHTMTFAVEGDRDHTVQLADAFYTQRRDLNPEPGTYSHSPYEFCDGNAQLRHLAEWRLLQGGTMKVRRRLPGGDDTLVEVPVYLQLMPFSRRSDQPALENTGDVLQFLGLGIEKVDMASEITQKQVSGQWRRTGKSAESARNCRVERLLDQIYEFSLAKHKDGANGTPPADDTQSADDTPPAPADDTQSADDAAPAPADGASSVNNTTTKGAAAPKTILMAKSSSKVTLC